MADPAFGRKLAGVTYRDRPGAYAFLWNDARTALAIVETPNGLFLPGGGLDPGETPLEGLRRELREEIGYELISAEFVARAEQFHWSEFYQSHFRKIGSFFTAVASPPGVETLQADHVLIWRTPAAAESELSQEFQRWAVGQLRRRTESKP